MENSTGATSGRMIRVISTQSRKNPSRKVIASTVSSTPVWPNGRPVSAARITSSPPRPRSTAANTVAPMKMPKMNAAVRLVWYSASLSTGRFRRRLAAAISNAPKAPTAEASVVVAMPKKIEPSTAKISASGGTTAQNTSSRARASSFGRFAGAGAKSFFSQATITM